MGIFLEEYFEQIECLVLYGKFELLENVFYIRAS